MYLFLYSNILYVCMYIYIFDVSHERKTIWANTKKGFHKHVKKYLKECGECIKYFCPQNDNESCGFFCLYIAIQYLRYKTFDIPKDYVKGEFKFICCRVLGNIEDSKYVFFLFHFLTFQ